MPYCYEFAAPAGSFGVRSDVDVAGPLKLYVGAWPWRAVADVASPDLEILRRPDGSMTLRLTAPPQIERSTGSVIESASGLLDMLMRRCLEHDPSYAGLHAGSVLIDGKLVVFPGDSHAGKSTLALQLVMRGHVMGGDDRLLVGPLVGDEAAPIEGVLMGLNARVRYPLHARAGAAFARFVDARRLPAEAISPSIGFIGFRAGELAPFGRRAPLSAIVVPVRREGGGVGLERAARSEIMRLLLEQMHAPHFSAAALTAVARAAADAVPGFVLRFDDSAQAAARIEALARSGFGDPAG
ncbi:MAG: hypothetical protein AB7R90_04300 [Reyranellaceae bacterium]